jgi:hypothetical protein
MSIFSKILMSCLVATIAIGTLGCGSSTNNDQGTSFLNLGYFADSTGSEGSLGQIVPLSSATSSFGGHGSDVRTFIGLVNLLSNQFIRVTRIDCNYDIAGADAGFSVPSDSMGISMILAASGTPPDFTPGGGGSVDGSPEYGEFQVVSSDILAYINANRNYLPQLPFRMIATCSATGVTQAGDILTSNAENYFIQFIEEDETAGVTVE